MKIQKYKPGEDINPYKNKNKYHQSYWYKGLFFKGYWDNNKYIRYKEEYRVWGNKGIKYAI
jgi:hypothetical protein